MIEPMKKVSVVILNKERETALKSLKSIGLLHLESLEGSGEKLSAFKEASANTVVSESILSEIKLPKKTNKVSNLSFAETNGLCSEIVEKSERKKQLMEIISADTNELDRFVKWGSVSLEDFDYLKENGVQLKLFEVPAEKYNLIEDNLQTILVNNDKKTVRFLLINSGNERPEGLIPEAFEITMPRVSTEELKKEIEDCKNEIDAIELFFMNKAVYLPSIVAYRKKLESDIEFENINSGMNRETEGAENDLAWISGYVPVADIEEFLTACRENKWAVAYEDAALDDVEVPTKLRNNKFVSLIYPLTDFLGTVPGYNEYDISGWFLLFFTIFFGMIFGDAGYGLLVTIVSLLMMLKNKVSKKPASPMLGLVTLVGAATVVWGAVTCTWFGIDPSVLPAWLTNLSIPVISSAQAERLWVPFWVTEAGVGLTKDQNLQIFCFSLALIQLSVAHIKAAKRNMSEKRFVKSLGDIGSLLQLIGMFWIVLSMVVNGKVFQMMGTIGSVPVGIIEISLIGIGFVMSFVFANYEGNIGQSILESCKNIISVLLGIVNVFSDIVSYIRLWAVGLAGAAISNTVNTMAGPILGHAILFIAAVALLVFGHGLNMILNLLSVIVHGVRLNTLEFSTHLGVSWSGTKYNPFKDEN